MFPRCFDFSDCLEGTVAVEKSDIWYFTTYLGSGRAAFIITKAKVYLEALIGGRHNMSNILHKAAHYRNLISAEALLIEQTVLMHILWTWSVA
jgi:hypothetical protein